MHKRKKQLLGLVGLAFVAVMTAIACALPAPGASAVTSDSVKVKVSVGVDGSVPEVRIEKFTFLDTDSVFQKQFEVTVSYMNATDLLVYLKQDATVPVTRAIDPTPAEGEISIDTSSCNVHFAHEWQTCELTYTLTDVSNLEDERGTGFTTRAEVFNQEIGNNNEAVESFVYRDAYLMNFGGGYVSNGDPSMEAVLSEYVKSAYVQVYDKDGNPVFLDTDGASEKPYKLHLDQINADGTLKFALPMWENQAKTGEYTVVLLAYSTEEKSEDGLIGLSTTGVTYTVKNPNKPGPNDPLDPNLPGGPNNPNNPDRPPVGPGGPTDPDNPDNPDNPDKPEVPETPGTGINLFRDLNISQADYLLTGLVAFGVVTAFAVFLIIRRSKR